MTSASRIDVPRLIRIATFSIAVAAAAGVYLTYQPQVDALQQRIDDNNSELRSDEIAFHEATALRGERAKLAARYASLLTQDAEAVFVRELATTVRRNGVTLVSTTVTPDDTSESHDPAMSFSKTRLALELRGSYRRLLAAIADLSMGSEIVEVLAPSLSRDATSVVAKVPVVIYEPLRTAQTAPQAHARNAR